MAGPALALRLYLATGSLEMPEGEAFALGPFQASVCWMKRDESDHPRCPPRHEGCGVDRAQSPSQPPVGALLGMMTFAESVR